jgi:hypothetical protein
MNLEEISKNLINRINSQNGFHWSEKEKKAISQAVSLEIKDVLYSYLLSQLKSLYSRQGEE